MSKPIRLFHALLNLVCKPINRPVFLICLGGLWLLHYPVNMVGILAMYSDGSFLNKPNIPAVVVQLAPALHFVFYALAVAVQAKRLISIGLPLWAAYPLPVAVVYLAVWPNSIAYFVYGLAAWLAALLLLPSGLPVKGQPRTAP